MDVYVARQPIFDRQKDIYGYELLFRDGMSNAFPDVDGDTATSSVLSSSYLDLGIDRIAGGKKAFINFTRDLLLKKIPTMFPSGSIIVEILEDVEPEDALIESCREIAQAGYDLALDDFLYRPDLEPLVALARVVKVDLRLTPLDEIEELVLSLSRAGIKMLAEKVETHEEFEQALDLGFEYFQGYFFSKPQIMSSKSLEPSKLNLMQMVAEVNRSDFTYESLEEIISRDVAISYKLLRYMNSAYFKRLQEISSIRQAIILLGREEVRRFISLMAMAKLASDKPNELIRASIIRAMFCELVYRLRSKDKNSEPFTVGLFSFIDAILDDSMERLMEKLPFSADIKDALVSGEGSLSDYLVLGRSYEAADWEGVSTCAREMGLDERVIPECYLKAVGWADSLVEL